MSLSKEKKKSKSISEDFLGIKDISLKEKRGLEIGNLTLMTSKKSYNKYRNILVKELGIKKLLFKKKKII